MIHDVADPQMIKSRSSCADPQLFQNHSNALLKSDPGVSIQGTSSKKTTFFPLP